MAYWNSSETSITLSGLKRNGMSRSNVRGLVAFCKVFRSDRLTNLIPGYTTRSVCCTLSPPSSRLPPICRCFPFSPLVCSASPLLFSLFFSSPFPFFLRSRVRSREFQGSKNRRKTREGMTRGILSCYPPPPPPLPSRSSTARSPLWRETRRDETRFRGTSRRWYWRGGGKSVRKV